MRRDQTSIWVNRGIKASAIVGLCLISSLIGGALTRHSGSTDYTLSYADFISILLTAISLLMTVLAIFLAVIGFVGWTSIEQKVHDKTEGFLLDGFKKGGRLDAIVVSTIEKKTEEIMFSGVEAVGSDDVNGNGTSAS
ncbi:hypothetical protein JK182_11120 [Acetobacter okinawensis]|uniref:hypothetical protein n=1 Tax=Acetobacter okinawensis TaxID=1076594 RepID=UPI001BA90B17|nr:hypothetical protein [Acetobacter okinawensis]MBS0989205.1 hypothetical protein [Acetobacter okinawensis]